MELLGRMLDLDAPPRRIESYDISNQGADDIRGLHGGVRQRKAPQAGLSPLQAEGHGRPRRLCLHEQVLTRRFQRYLDGDEKFSDKPDLLLNRRRRQPRQCGGAGAGEPGPAYSHLRHGEGRPPPHPRPGHPPRERRSASRETRPSSPSSARSRRRPTALPSSSTASSGRAGPGLCAGPDPRGGGEAPHSALKHFKSVRAIREAPLEELEQVVRAGAHGGEEVPFLLSTIHSSKGLEYGRVILMDVADGIFPKTVPEGPEPEQAELDAYEEERRLFYVGMTRAKNELPLYASERRDYPPCLRRSSFPRHGRPRPNPAKRPLRWRWARTVTPSPPWGKRLCPACGCGTGPLGQGCCAPGTETSPRSPLTASRQAPLPVHRPAHRTAAAGGIDERRGAEPS